jgi:IrrE N-terminal-like domain
MTRWVCCLVVCLILARPSRGQVAHCDCQPALRHLCRCGVLIEQDLAERQLDYLNRLMLAEFRDELSESPVLTVRLEPAHKMVLKGEDAQGYFDNGKIVLNDTLRRDQALMVLAHELGHAWHFSTQPEPDAISDFLAEGFAEWVSYHLMKRAGLTEFCHNLRVNPDPLYGNACRWYLGVEEEFGKQAVLNIMADWLHQDGKKRSLL